MKRIATVYGVNARPSYRLGCDSLVLLRTASGKLFEVPQEQGRYEVQLEALPDVPKEGGGENFPIAVYSVPIEQGLFFRFLWTHAHPQLLSVWEQIKSNIATNKHEAHTKDIAHRVGRILREYSQRNREKLAGNAPSGIPAKRWVAESGEYLQMRFFSSVMFPEGTLA